MAKFSEEAIDWWPVLNTIVENVNKAAENKDKLLLDNTFIEAVNILGMHIEHERVKGADIVTVVEVKREFDRLLWNYIRDTKRFISMKRRLGESAAGVKPLTASTVKQYSYYLQGWPKGRIEYKKEIKELSSQIKGLSVCKRLQFKMVGFLMCTKVAYPK